MTTYGTSLVSTLLVPAFVQAATAPELQALMTAALAQIASDDDGNVIGVNLAGAGDGHTFVAEINVSSAPLGTSYEASDMRASCYLAGTAEELAVARVPVLAAMAAETPPRDGASLTFVDEMVVGSSKGTQFMGMIIGQWTGGGGG
jgi:hypothetical protein